MNTCFKDDDIVIFFENFDGYMYGHNDDLATYLEKLNLLDENRRKDIGVVGGYYKCLFSISFIQMINAWQWFLSAQHLRSFSASTAQRVQNEYYSLFFSISSFLALNAKGMFTVKQEVVEGDKIRKIRMKTWLDVAKVEVVIGDIRGKGGQHGSMGNWFNSVFKNYDGKGNYLNILVFEDDANFHSSFRNLFTYSLDSMAEDMFEGPKASDLTNADLEELWNADTELCEIYPETCYNMEYIKLVTNLHSKLVTDNSKSLAYTKTQQILLAGFYEHCKFNERLDFVKIAFKDIFAACDL